MSKKGDYEVVPVTDDEVIANPARKGKWKIVRKGGVQQINGDFSSKEEAEEHLNKLFPEPEPEPEIGSDPDEESGPSLSVR